MLLSFLVELVNKEFQVIGCRSDMRSTFIGNVVEVEGGVSLGRAGLSMV
jgi:hypothetical protein